MTFLRSFLLTLGALLLLGCAFAGGYLFRERTSTAANFTILNQAYDILTKNGLKDTPAPPALEYGMIRGMVQAYDDPYTVFVDPPQHELETNALQGSFGGIGVRLGQDEAENWVLHPFPDSPAAKAGVLDGDRLLAVGTVNVDAHTPIDRLQAAIRGPVGQKVSVTVGRAPDYAPLKMSIERAEIPIPSVTWHLDPSQPQVGVLEINLIAASTADELQRGVKDLQARGAAYFVLDLRNNPGGLLNAGIDVARLFLKDGTVIDQEYRGRPVETFKVEKPGPLVDLPLVVLINKGSASAAEIIAGALKTHGRALLVGEPSYGKDTVQLVFDLKDGSSLHVTAAHWWVPGLDPPLGGVGLQPDIPVTPPAEASGPDPVVQAAIKSFTK